jgi:hypothetical protein
MRVTQQELVKLVREELEELNEARLPAWERPGYDPTADEGGDEREVLVRGYGRLRIDQIRKRLITMIQEAGEDVQKEPPRFSHFKSGVMVAFYEALKEHGAI